MMKHLILFLIGLFVGVACTVIGMNALSKGKEMKHGTMASMAYHMGAIGQMIEKNQCDATQTEQHIAAIEYNARDVDHAFRLSFDTESSDWQHFKKYSADMVAAANKHRVNPPTNCDALKSARGDLGQGCKMCHRDFKS